MKGVAWACHTAIGRSNFGVEVDPGTALQSSRSDKAGGRIMVRLELVRRLTNDKQ
jgi:hypothetical protein